MRVCPKCGYIDPAHWKHVRFSYHIDSCNWETFQTEYPELAKNLTKGGAITEDKDYYYRLTKNKIVVLRKAKVEWTEFQGNPFGAEKYEKFPHTNRGKKVEKAISNRPYWRDPMHGDSAFDKMHPSQRRLSECEKR